MSTLTRRLLTTLGSAGAATALTLGLLAATGPADAHHAQPPGPVHAGSEYGWGNPRPTTDSSAGCRRASGTPGARGTCATSTGC